MNDIQLIQNAVAVNFSNEVAGMILDRMSCVYGAEFSKKFAGTTNDELTQLACTVFSGLSAADIARGLKRMNSEEWCPNLPKFRSWCEQAGDWWTADQAWAKAMMFESNPKNKISKLAKRVLDEVRHILTVEGQKSAHYAFKDIYQDYLGRAKDKGRTQEMWVEPTVVPKLAHDESKRKGIPCPVEFVQKIKSVNALGRKGVEA